MVVACGESFLRIVVRNCLTLVFNGSSTETSKLGFFFKATLRFLGLVDFLVLFAVTSILHTEQSVQTGEQFFK